MPRSRYLPIYLYGRLEKKNNLVKKKKNNLEEEDSNKIQLCLKRSATTLEDLGASFDAELFHFVTADATSYLRC